MQKNYFILPFILSLFSLLLAGAPDTLWTRTYGGAESDRGYSVQQTSDRGFIITGYTESFGAGEKDVYLIRTDSNGDTLWTKTYGGSELDRGYCVQQTSDGGFIIGGVTNLNIALESCDVYLIQTDSNGDTLWTRTYGGDSSDYGYSVQKVNDGGFIVTGETYSYGAGSSDMYLIRTNSSGDTIWTKTYGGASYDDGNSVQQVINGGFIIVGTTASFGASDLDIYIIHTNTSGDTIWTKTYSGIDSDDFGLSVQQINDGGFIIAGLTRSFTLNSSVYLIRTNSTGDTLWTKTYGETNHDEGNSVQQTSDGGFIIAGVSSSGVDERDIYLIRTNSTGDTLWTKTYGGINNDVGYSVQQTNDGGFIVVGYTESFGAGGEDVYLIRLDTSSIGIQDDNSFNFLNPNNFIISYTNNNLISIRYTIQHSSPVNLSMYNTAGQLVKTLFNEYKNAGDHTINFKTDNISAGVYYFKLTAGKSSYTRKAVVVGGILR